MTASRPWRRAAASDRPGGTVARRLRLGPGLSRPAGEARREAVSDRATVASGPARPDRGATLLARACSWCQVERRLQQVGLGVESRERQVGSGGSDFPK
jgi:hypothetical protein